MKKAINLPQETDPRRVVRNTHNADPAQHQCLQPKTTNKRNLPKNRSILLSFVVNKGTTNNRHPSPIGG
jgi:hypothetical protein